MHNSSTFGAPPFGAAYFGEEYTHIPNVVPGTTGLIVIGVEDTITALEGATIPKGIIVLDRPGVPNSAIRPSSTTIMEDTIVTMESSTVYMGGKINYDSDVTMAEVTLADDKPKMDTVDSIKPLGFI